MRAWAARSAKRFPFQDTRLRAMSLSLTFAVLLICGVAALGLVLLIMLIRLIFRSAAACSGS